MADNEKNEENNDSRNNAALTKPCKKSLSKHPTFPEVKSLAKKFVNDPAVFSMSDPDEVNRG